MKNLKILFFSYSFWICIAGIASAQTTKTNVETVQIKTKELEQKLKILTFTDLQNTMVELNLVRSKLDEHLDYMSKNCQNITERAKEQQCMSEVKETLKKLWMHYFQQKEKYLNSLYKHYLAQNQEQTKTTLDFIDSLQTSKVKK